MRDKMTRSKIHHDARVRACKRMAKKRDMEMKKISLVLDISSSSPDSTLLSSPSSGASIM